MIVLGAHVKGTVLTKAPLERVRKALEYLEHNSETKAILSGGQGDGENITEAEAMKRYLAEHGIAEERLILEDRSTSTAENIRFSLKLIESKDMKIGIVTNHYHVFRGVAIARKAGCTRVYGIAAPYRTRKLFWYIPREILAIIKDKLIGNL